METSGPAVVPVYKPSRSSEYASHRERGPAEKLSLLWRERRFFWGLGWKTALVAAMVAFMLPKHYNAVTKIVPGESQSSTMALLGKLGGVGGSTSGSLGLDPVSMMGLKTPGAFYIEIMKSRTVQDQLIRTFDLQTHYFMGAARFRFLRGKLYSARKKLQEFTSFDEDKRSGVITVTCNDYDPRMAAQICNAYVAEMNRLAIDLNTSDAHRERVFLEERLKSAKEDLDQASLALSRFSSKSTVMDPESQSSSLMDTVARVQGELIVAQTDLKGYQQIYSDDNVKVRTAKARIGELQSQLKRLLGDSTAQPPEQAPSYPSMRALPMLGYQYSDLYRQTRIQETVYEFLTQQYEMAKIQEAKELPTVRVMDPAVPPEKKAGPSRILVIVLSVLGGLALGLCWVLARSAWERLPIDDPRRALAAEVSADCKAAVRTMKSGA